jgi:hypothetical protein
MLANKAHTMCTNMSNFLKNSNYHYGQVFVIPTVTQGQTCSHHAPHSLLSVQFEAAKLSVYDNKWSEIYDFTPADGNWSFLPANTKVADIMKPLADVEGTFVTKEEQEQHSEDSVVPVTVGLRKSDYAGQERAFILMLPSGVAHGPALLSKLPEECSLIQTKQLQLDAAKVGLRVLYILSLFWCEPVFLGKSLVCLMSPQVSRGHVAAYCENIACAGEPALFMCRSAYDSCALCKSVCSCTHVRVHIANDITQLRVCVCVCAHFQRSYVSQMLRGIHVHLHMGATPFDECTVSVPMHACMHVCMHARM